MRPNLGFWLADQFQSVLKRYRTLFLGPYITLLAINLCVLDPENNDLKEQVWSNSGRGDFNLLNQDPLNLWWRVWRRNCCPANYSFYIHTTFEHLVRENGTQAEQDGAEFGRILRECGIYPTISAKPIDIMWIKAHNSGKFLFALNLLSLRFNFYVSFDYLTLGTM